MWDMYELECVESEPGDPEHLCAQWRDPSNCQYFPDCGWDARALHCVQISDLHGAPPVTPYGRGTGMGTGFGSGFGPFANNYNSYGGYDSGTAANPQFNGGGTYSSHTCDEYYKPTQCSQNFNDFAKCVWDKFANRCYEQNLDQLCEAMPYPEQCRSTEGCGWELINSHGLCVVCNEVQPSNLHFVQGCASYQNPYTVTTHGYASNTYSGSSYGNIECEDYASPSQCDGRDYYGASCYWALISNRCEMVGYLMRPEHVRICKNFRHEERCSNDEVCRWKKQQGTCLARSSYAIERALSHSRGQNNWLTSRHRISSQHQPPTWTTLFSFTTLGVLVGIAAACFKFRRRKQSDLSESLTSEEAFDASA